MLQCRPFYLPREFTSVTITAVYAPLQAIARLAMEKLHLSMSQHQSAHPDSIVIAARLLSCQLEVRPAEIPQICEFLDKRMQHSAGQTWRDTHQLSFHTLTSVLRLFLRQKLSKWSSTRWQGEDAGLCV